MTSVSPLEALGLSPTQRDVFGLGMEALDANYRPPLLWSSAKLSSWYAVGLLARSKGNDQIRANALLHNLLSAQDTDPTFPQGYGTFKDALALPFPSGPDPLWASKAYESYDSNNALFVALAIVMIEALFGDMVEPDLRERLREALHKACIGNAKREIGYYGDNMHPTYSNPWMLRCVCTTVVANLVGDADLLAQAEGWANETRVQFAQHGSPGEFNSPTYAGGTMMALSLAQYCPPSSTIAQIAPGILKDLWESLADVYNPTLKNITGPWDRTYGYCMTQYYATVGATIASVTGLEDAPIPKPLIGCEHGSDVALLPLQMIVAPYCEASLTPALRDKFKTLTPHRYTPQAFSPPHDISPRQYTFHLAHGLSVGGVCFDEDVLGGPAKNVQQFTPGTIQWDSGDHGGGVGWIVVWPEHAACDIVATPTSLTIKNKKASDFPNSPKSRSITLHIGCLPFLQLNRTSFDGNKASLPGLDVEMGGNVGVGALSFDKTTRLHGAPFYRLQFQAPSGVEEPELVISFRKTKPPVYDLRMSPV